MRALVVQDGRWAVREVDPRVVDVRADPCYPPGRFGQCDPLDREVAR